MEKKNNKTVVIAIISVLLIVIAALATLVIVLLFGKIKGKNQSGNVENAAEITEDAGNLTKQEETEAMEEVENPSFEDSRETIIDLDGFEFRIPTDYGCFITEVTGPVIYMDDVFQIKLAVRDTSYEEMMEDPDDLTAKTIEAGGMITKDVEEVELNGKKYAYFGMELEGDSCLVVYTKAVDETKRFAGQIVILSDSVTDDDLLHVFAQITENATVTDRPNTTDDDLYVPTPVMGEVKEASSLTTKAGTVSFKVPKGFYSEGKYEEEDNYASESFTTADYAVMVDCTVLSVEEWGNAADYFASEMEDEVSYGEDVKEESAEVDGEKVSYYIATYDHNGSAFQELCAVREVGGVLYQVKAVAIDWSEELTFEMIREFLMGV